MIRKRITFANVTAFVALFVALSAGSYAAISLPANSVGTKQIRAKAVKSVKLATKAVTGPKIAANAVDSSKVRNGSLTGADINLTTLGKVPSAAAADSAAIARVKIVSAPATSRPSAGFPPPIDVATATCDQGLVVVGGGVSVDDQSTQFVNDTAPNGNSAWTGHVVNEGPGTPGFTVYAICAPATSTQ